MERAKVGDRVRITGILPDDPQPLELGAEGTVEHVNDGGRLGFVQYAVKWDNGRSLMLLQDDPFIVIASQP